MLIDALASVGDPGPSQQHIDATLEGLPHDFGPVVFVIESKFDYVQLEEVEALLLVHEMHHQKFKKLLQSETDASTNLTQITSNAKTASTSQQDLGT
jgi:hypothetical protein